MDKPAGKTRKAETESPRIEGRNIDMVEARINRAMPSDIKNPNQQFDETEKNDKKSKRKSLDPLTNSLGATTYYHKMIWPQWFYREVSGLNYKLVVDRYYEEKKVAIDFKLNSREQMLIPLKKKLLGEHGILYFHLTDMDSVNDMLAQLQEQ